MVILANKSGGSQYPTGYTNLDHHGLIGDTYTAALVSVSGTVASYCFPHFDSPSVFARILDKNKGGHWSITTRTPTTTKQQYSPSTNILNTKFLSDDGVAQLSDYMPVPGPGRDIDPNSGSWLVRTVEVIRGTLSFHVEVAPAFDYGRAEHDTKIVSDTSTWGSFSVQTPGRVASPMPINGGASAPAPKAPTPIPPQVRSEAKRGDSLPVVGEAADADQQQKVVFTCPEHVNLELRYVTAAGHDIGPSTTPLPPIKLDYLDLKERGHKGFGVAADFTLTEGHWVTFVLREAPEGCGPSKYGVNGKKEAKEGEEGLRSVDPPLTKSLVDGLHAQTTDFWLKWARKCTYRGRWREAVLRSALTLKLLTFSPTGAIVAAPTFSLPEDLNGAGRNWDYRYSWLRDSSFSIYALVRVGFTEEADRYMDWLSGLLDNRRADGSLSIMYTIHSSDEIPELELDHLDGHKGQKPVRIGNGAADHLQLDIYGEVMDAIYLSQKFSKPLSWDRWKQVRSLVDYVCDVWDQPDLSIWEVRGEKQDFLYSKIMCWVAVDRGLRLADKRSLPAPNRDRWLKTRDAIYEEVQERGWNEEHQQYGQSYQRTDVLDASVVVAALTFFSNGNDPRFLSTLKAILKPRDKGGLTENHMVYRYDTAKVDDGTGGGEEGAFSMVTCWTIEALVRCGEYDPKLLQEAAVFLEDFMGYSNHLGLLSEEISKDGTALGNMPQAFSHVGLISACFNLDRMLSKHG